MLFYVDYFLLEIIVVWEFNLREVQVGLYKLNKYKSLQLLIVIKYCIVLSLKPIAYSVGEWRFIFNVTALTVAGATILSVRFCALLRDWRRRRSLLPPAFGHVGVCPYALKGCNSLT